MDGCGVFLQLADFVVKKQINFLGFEHNALNLWHATLYFGRLDLSG